MASRSARKSRRASSAGTASPSMLTGPSARMSRQTTTSPAMPARSNTRRVSSPFRTCSNPLRQAGDGARGAGELQDVQARVRAVHDVDVAAVVHLEVVGLDRGLAAVGAVHL